jgi:hypothetical protein
MANNCREKSAEAIVETDTSLQKGKKSRRSHEDSKGGTLRSVQKFKLPNERKKAEKIVGYLFAKG